MKILNKLLILLVLLLMSNSATSQTTSTPSSKAYCLNKAQVVEVYKGLKQGEQLKKQLTAAEELIQSQTKTIQGLEKQVGNQEVLIKTQKEYIHTTEFVYLQDKKIDTIKIEQLNRDITASNTQGRKKFWNGILIGGVVGVSVTTLAFLLLK